MSAALKKAGVRYRVMMPGRDIAAVAEQMRWEEPLKRQGFTRIAITPPPNDFLERDRGTIAFIKQNNDGIDAIVVNPIMYPFLDPLKSAHRKVYATARVVTSLHERGYTDNVGQPVSMKYNEFTFDVYELDANKAYKLLTEHV